MAYNRTWGGPHPGCLIILLDQSGSMGKPFPEGKLGKGKIKAEIVATVLNRLLLDFIRANTVGTDVRARADVAVLGYGGKKDSGTETEVRPMMPGDGSPSAFMNLPELYASPIRIEAREEMTEEIMDDTGKIIKIPIQFPIWVEPLAHGGTPMCAALEQARELASQWAANHPDNFPPVVINITDGVATDGDPTGPAQKLRTVTTSDGEALLFNCHITELPGPTVEFPADPARVPNDQFAQQLFSMSSGLPDACRAESEKQGQPLDPGARGFIFNGDAGSVTRMFVYVTQGAQIDLNM